VHVARDLDTAGTPAGSEHPRPEGPRGRARDIVAGLLLRRPMPDEVVDCMAGFPSVGFAPAASVASQELSDAGVKHAG
jgi:hypothetical protein